MSLTINNKTVSRAESAIKRGDVSHDEWSAPPGSKRQEQDCLATDEAAPDAGRLKYPIFSDGKVNRKALSSALAYAEKGGDTEVAAACRKLIELADAKEQTAASASPRLSKCPTCQSFDVERIAGDDTAGPTDKCKRCNTTWPHKPGTITAEQISGIPEEIAASARCTFALALDANGDGDPIFLDGLPTTDSEGAPIHYRRVEVAPFGQWTHKANGKPLPVTKDRVEEWIANTAKLAAAGFQPFLTKKHPYDAAGNFIAPDPEDTLGEVIRIEHDGNSVYAVIAVHGDEELHTVAKNKRSVGIANNVRDARGGVVKGESLHHLAIVPNPALPNLGSTERIAASADSTATSVPVYELSATPNRSTDMALDPKKMKALRDKMKWGTDMSDDDCVDAMHKKVMAMDDEPGETAAAAEKAKADILALTGERDAAVKERDTIKGKLVDTEKLATEKEQRVLALSAYAPKEIDPLSVTLITRAFKNEREQVIASGVISEAGMKEIDALLFSDGKPAQAALALSAGSVDPFYSRLCDAIRRNPGIKTGNNVPRSMVATPVAAASAPGEQQKHEPTEAELNAERQRRGIPVKA